MQFQYNAGTHDPEGNAAQSSESEPDSDAETEAIGTGKTMLDVVPESQPLLSQPGSKRTPAVGSARKGEGGTLAKGESETSTDEQELQAQSPSLANSARLERNEKGTLPSKHNADSRSAMGI